MNPKKRVILLVLTHILCLILGYYIGASQPTPKESIQSATLPGDNSDYENHMQPSMAEPQTTEPSPITEETMIATEETEVPTSTPETKPRATKPPVVQPPATLPPTTQPPATTGGDSWDLPEV